MVFFVEVVEIFNGQALDKLLRAARDGNAGAREQLISDHEIFIKKIASKNSTGYEDIYNRDEYSIAMMAFNEAIDGYKPGLRTFHSFAAEVIKRRIIDYHRSCKCYREHNLYILDEEKIPLPDNVSFTDKVHVKLEMEAYVKSLSRYNINFRDLIEETPKHADSRLLCIRIAKNIVGDPEMKNHFVKYGTIPLKMLLTNIKINKKTVERHRKYIIAICLVLLSDLDTMKEYVAKMDRGGESDAL